MRQIAFLTYSLALVSSLLFVIACGPNDEGLSGSNLILAQSWLKGKTTQPARLVIVRPAADESKPWESEIITSDAGSNAYHKAMYFTPAIGEPGILSISANPPLLDIWRKKGEKWESQTYWTGTVGDASKNGDRLRDMEVGDVDGDGEDEIVIVTHNQGVVMVFDADGDTYEPTEVSRTEKLTFVHEVEIGDVNGDGIKEFFTTPSEPNQLDGGEQSGDVMMFRFDGSKYVESLVEHYPNRHAKEILCADIDGKGKPVLLVSLEGAEASLTASTEPSGSEKSSTEIRMYRWEGETMTSEDIMALPGDLCRFLCVGDTRGDGKLEIIASTYADGIFSIYKEDDVWKKKLVCGPSKSSAFEHATIVFDRDGDGKDEVFVASDNQSKLHRFYYDETKKGYKAQTLMTLPSGKSFTWNMMPIPKGW